MKKIVLLTILCLFFLASQASACTFAVEPGEKMKIEYLKPIAKTTGFPGYTVAKGLYVKISDTGGGGADCGPFQTHVNIAWLGIVLLAVIVFLRRRSS